MQARGPGYIQAGRPEVILPPAQLIENQRHSSDSGQRAVQASQPNPNARQSLALHLGSGDGYLDSEAVQSEV